MILLVTETISVDSNIVDNYNLVNALPICSYLQCLPTIAIHHEKEDYFSNYHLSTPNLFTFLFKEWNTQTLSSFHFPTILSLATRLKAGCSSMILGAKPGTSTSKFPTDSKTE